MDAMAEITMAVISGVKYGYALIPYYLLPPFQNIRCFRFMKQMYIDTF
jgi:hypothetical protein